MSLLQEIQNASKTKVTVNENAGCSMENEEKNEKETSPKKAKKPKIPMIVKTLKAKFPDTSSLTVAKVKTAIKSEFKKEAFSVEKEEWEKMSKDEQTNFAKAVLDHLNK